MYCTPVCFGLLFAVDHANTHLACPRQSGNTTTSSTEGKANRASQSQVYHYPKEFKIMPIVGQSQMGLFGKFDTSKSIG